MNAAVLQSGLSPSVVAAVTAAFVTALLGALATTLRYVFDVQLVTSDEVEDKIESATGNFHDDLDDIIGRLDDHSEHLDRLEDLLMGGEYQISDGMLELIEVNADEIEDHDERIDGVERIQLKIRRRQRESSGGEMVAEAEDVNPPPDYDERITDTANDPDDSDEGNE